MKRIVFFLLAAATLPAIASSTAPASGQDDGQAVPIFAIKIYPGYRDWRLISVAHEEGNLNDLRAVLGNGPATRAFRKDQRPFPDGTILVRLAWRYEASAQNDATFGQHQSFVAGDPTNVQVMVKNAKRYARTGGWGFAQFNDGKPVEAKALTACFSCHETVRARDFVFNLYAP